jgi:hypothetical protein
MVQDCRKFCIISQDYMLVPHQGNDALTLIATTGTAGLLETVDFKKAIFAIHYQNHIGIFKY